MQNKGNLTDSVPHETARHPAAVSRVLGITVFAALILWVITGRSAFVTFLDAESIAIAVLGPIALLIACFGWCGAKTALVTLVGGNASPRGTVEAVSFFRLAAVFALACGFLGTLIGIVIMLENLDDPVEIGPAMALALLTQLYGVLLAVLSLVCATIVSRREAIAQSFTELDRLVRQSLAIGAPATAIGVLAVVVSFLIIGLTMAGVPS